MTNSMEAKLRARINWLSLVAVVTALAYAGLLIYREQLPTLSSFIKGFHTGAFIGLELVVVFYLGKHWRASKDRSRMNRLHIEENDERTMSIVRHASTVGMTTILAGLSVAAIVAGFFSITVFMTLFGAMLFVLIVFYGLWLYYARRF